MADWCREMELATGLSLPWRLLRSKLASLDEATGKVKYRETFEANCTSGTQDRRLVSRILLFFSYFEVNVN